MTKRIGSYQAINGKKPRLEDEDLWEDDLDPEALEKCFEQATQNDVAPSQQHETSVSASYNAFKIPGAFLASTQMHNDPSTSNRWSLQQLEVEIKNLKRKNEEKEGEISILRSRIREVSCTVKAEQQRTTNEWREKFHNTQKEANSIASDLEFKNLEIANLKQQLAETRRFNVETLNSSQMPPPAEPKLKPDRLSIPGESSKSSYQPVYKEAIVEQIYPLKSLNVDTITNWRGSSELHMIKKVCYKTSRNTIPYLQNQPTYNETSFNHKCSRLENIKITTDHLYPDVLKLINSDLETLNSPSCLEPIQKVLCINLILLKDLSDYLVEYGLHMRTEDIQQLDGISLLGNETKRVTRSQKGLLGSQASKSLNIMAQLLLYNPLLSAFICNDAPLELLGSLKEYAKLIPHRNCAVQNDYYVLRLLLSITGNIGKYRLVHETSDFLISAINFLESIARLDNDQDRLEKSPCMDLFCKIFKEIIFARPKPDVIKRITFLLKICSSYKVVIRFLFKKNGSNEMLKATPKGVLYFTEDVCTFCVLAILLQNYLLNSDQVPLEVCYNMLDFIYVTFKTSHWIHHENGDHVCGCLSQFYKMEIDFVFRALDNLMKVDRGGKGKGISVEWRNFLNHNIIQKVLNQMKFNNFELTEKYVPVFTRYKEIEKTLNTEGAFKISELNNSEELPNVSEKDFNKDF